MHVVATAGHVDHGKSSLVRALTGTDPDRFAEEKARGLTIDLGFAWTALPSGAGVAFVDVPGHVRFLKNMLAGVGGVDACLFVVAATEGWKEQSEEHLRILELLGISHGMVALTKVGAVDDDTAALAEMEIADRLQGTFLADAEIVGVDSLDGSGLDALRRALDGLLARTPTARDRDRPRLWIDRAFAPSGAGTVITGTLTGGPLHVDDALIVWSSARARQHPVRVRGLQSLGESHDVLEPGTRAAVNITKLSHHEITRGDALVRPDQWHAATIVDASLDVLASLDHDVSRRGAFLAYVGSGEYPVKVRVLGDETIGPGTRGLVRLRLPVALPLVAGDRFVLRESGRAETVGGGEILDVDPQLPASRARPDRSVDRVLAERGWVESAMLERLTGERRDPMVGRWVVAPAALEATRAEVRAALDVAGPLGLEMAALDERAREVLATLDGIELAGGRAVIAGQGDPLAHHPYVEALAVDLFRPPDPEEAGVDPAALRELVRRGLVVESDGVYFAPAAIDAAAAAIAGLLADQPDGVTVSEVRAALETTRRWAVPLLNVLDRTGVTRRRGDHRIAGPRLPDEIA